MSRFFETIKILNGEPQQLTFHQRRFEETRRINYGVLPKTELKDIIEIPEHFRSGLVRCRVDYAEKLESVHFYPYQMSAHTKIKIVEAGDFDYSFKFSDRTYFGEQLSAASGCDDIIFTRDGFLTDASYSNLVLGNNEKWFTPDTYLLNGTKRQRLLSEKKISEKKIHINDLINFEKIAFINAMRDFEKVYSFIQTDDYLILNPSTL